MQILVAVTDAGRGVAGMIDGEPPVGVETEQDVADRKDLCVRSATSSDRAPWQTPTNRWPARVSLACGRRARDNRRMSSSVERRSNPTAWAAFWFALAGLLLMPIPLFIGLILGGALSDHRRSPRRDRPLQGPRARRQGHRPVVFAAIFIALTWGGISVGGGTVW